MRNVITLFALLPLLLACGGSDSDPDAGSLSLRSVYPNTGPEDGDQAVAVGGSGFFAGIDAVLFDGLPAYDVEVTSDNNINCRTPAHTAGAVDVEVITDAGESVTLVNGYVYNRPPVILSVVPLAGTAGLTVSIVGRDLDDRSGRAPTVLFGDQQSPLPQVVNSSLIFATVPGGQPTAGAVDVTVINDSGSDTQPNGFIYLSAALGDLGPVDPEVILAEGFGLIEDLLALGGLALPGLDLPTQTEILEIFRDALANRP